jgi:hypothetical protein
VRDGRVKWVLGHRKTESRQDYIEVIDMYLDMGFTNSDPPTLVLTDLQREVSRG